MKWELFDKELSLRPEELILGRFNTIPQSYQIGFISGNKFYIYKGYDWNFPNWNKEVYISEECPILPKLILRLYK